MVRTVDRILAASVLALMIVAATAAPSSATTYYVRQTVGDEKNDGLTPETAWKGITRLSNVMQAGDIVYIGPGLYREQITVMNSGTADKRIIFIADTTGQHTGDPPGVVMITGADPVDESVFQPHTTPGVYKTTFPKHVEAVVEMDGDQFRYARARDTMEHLKDKLTEMETVEKLQASQFYDAEKQTLYIHTSDNKPPTTHEIEIMFRGNAIGTWNKHFVTIVGFTFRHFGDSAISFFQDSTDVAAINNTSWGGRQGIRVFGARRVLIYGNTLFRNDNSGVYFAKQSTDGHAIANISYENKKGLRWSSQSVNPVILDNISFNNKEAGIALEDVDHVLVRRNMLVDNKGTAFMPFRADYTSEDNCYQVPATELATDYVLGPKYKTLADFQKAQGQDMHSRSGNCGTLPKKIDVHKLHAETMEYAEKARKILADSPKPTPRPQTPTPVWAPKSPEASPGKAPDPASAD